MMACTCPRPIDSPNPRKAGSCASCARPTEHWQLTEGDARAYYAGIGIPEIAEQALSRLRTGGLQYGWWAYLDRHDNPAQAIEELLDTLHYALFETFRQHKLEAEGKSEEDADTVRAHLAHASAAAVEAIKHFEAARRLA